MGQAHKSKCKSQISPPPISFLFQRKILFQRKMEDKEDKERKLGWVFYIFAFKISFLIYELISLSNFN